MSPNRWCLASEENAFTSREYRQRLSEARGLFNRVLSEELHKAGKQTPNQDWIVSEDLGLLVPLWQRLVEEYETGPLIAHDILALRRRHAMRSVFPGGGVVHMRQWELRFNDNLNQIVFPVAVRHYGENRMVLNKKLSRFNRELMLHNKGKCLLYFVYSYPRSAAKLFYCSWILQVLCPMLLVLFLVRLWIYRGRPTVPTADKKPERRRVLQMVFWTALLFYLASSTLVFLSFTAASRRYILPAGVFVPSLVALLILRELELIAASCSPRDESPATDK